MCTKSWYSRHHHQCTANKGLERQLLCFVLSWKRDTVRLLAFDVERVRDRETERQIERQTKTQTDRQTNRKRGREKNI